ncbi:MAG: hypothetical protein ACD_27C00003G0001 [uncultured bacterium]|jgi:hypothetical protein|uniref:DUF948 domain-containing protein n=2 Tax=Candidatus Collieribacteriota TaxID=1752725 RepID=A0A1F5FXJ3_9BACT|nr:MAG: hypothetical protein ACD_27C00003G0001 [uncultured bacterium]KKU21582.1 MAG: hypothetical protein UX32_C0001G0027 [Microgenomates group bacterium GW2011_GWF1_46_12]KKU26913.1 MAG: hypothetical protein UX38_C0002G0093 [Microgenomates group bacterium GW2011_GWC1_46_16]KKU28330.1 MAG: hypothetical protein UX40_C0001G0093 [Microgenomates group bacterium GW2011_GWF2_46_18]KKU43805.1 MAG: hypothetical protein UX59_C0009G0008 [Microgenomates group bacterium GW2011_GWA1_46_7]KKU45208.1 MAG: hy
MDLPQIILLVVILTISVILIVIGIQLIGILKDAKETLKKTDLILDDVSFLTRSLTRGGSALSHAITSLESGLQLVGMVTKLIAPKVKK